MPAVTNIPAHPVGRLVPERHHPLLVSLADARQVSLVQVEIAGAECHQLRDAKSRRVQHFNQRLVAQSARRAGVGLREQTIHLFE